MRRTLIALACLAAFTPARAEPTWWLNLGGISLHDAPGRNGSNPATAIEVRTSDTWAFGAGQFVNSERETSRFAAITYTPWVPYRRVHTGFLVAVVDGYPINDGRPLAVAAFVADVRWQRVALSLNYVPSLDRSRWANTLSLQLKLSYGE